MDWMAQPKQGVKKTKKKNKFNLKWKAPTAQIAKNPMKWFPQSSTLVNFPKGVPKSFLKQQEYQFPATAPWIQQIENNMDSEDNQFYMDIQFEPSTSKEAEKQTQQQKDLDRYSPTEADLDQSSEIVQNEESSNANSEDVDSDTKQKNVFDRLGPPQPKKPNLKINLLCDQDYIDRKVIVENPDDDKYIPAHLRQEVLTSTDPIVMKNVTFWPWKKENEVKKQITANYYAGLSKYEQEQILSAYDSWDTFVQVSVTGYPPSWDKEDVLDALIECVRGKTFIPCFIEFLRDKCTFLVLESREALKILHDYDLCVRKDDVILCITISLTYHTLDVLDFAPEIVLRKLLTAGYDAEKLSLKTFTNREDISYFIHFPLYRISNQTHLTQITGAIAWDFIVDLDLSDNKLTSIAGFNLVETTPKLKHLNLSDNLLDKLTALLCCKSLLLKSLVLEGNPVCTGYRDPKLYVQVIKKIFPTIKSIDGVEVASNGEMPKFHRNYCSEEERNIVDILLEVYFPLLESSKDQRQCIEEMYDEDAVMTITYKHKLRRTSMYQHCQDLLLRARCLEDGKIDSLQGAAAIAKHITKWPKIKHDPLTFTVDVLHHTVTSTIIRVGGLLKVTTESLADEEHLLAFTKTFVLKPIDAMEYKIVNQMIFWDEPTREFAISGFKITMLNSNYSNLHMDSVPDDDQKEKYVELLMKLTTKNRVICMKCLEIKNWNFKNALLHFATLLESHSVSELNENNLIKQ